MAIEARIRELGHRHKELDHKIQVATRHPATDDLELRDMKRRKLHLKEEMETLRQQAS